MKVADRNLEGFNQSVLTNEDYTDARASIMVGFKRNENVKFEDFKIVTLLGRGTFGKVFLATLPSENDRQFAIKAIRKDIEYLRSQGLMDYSLLLGIETSSDPKVEQ